ncbi:hypothetical protein KKA24_00725 [Patescibacteria group bacterium]|nr:hypothetical protein [Patescibacteria group bacterium]
MNNNIEKPIESDLNSLESSLKDDPFFADSNSKKGKTFIIKIIAGVVGLVLISGGAVLASRAWDPVWNPFRPSPEKVLSKMINNDSAKNLHINSNISFVKKGSESVGISMTSSEDLDSNDEKNIKSKGSFDMVIESEGIQYKK